MSRSKLINRREMRETTAVLVIFAVVAFVSSAFVLLFNLTEEPREPDLSLCPFCDQPVRH